MARRPRPPGPAFISEAELLRVVKEEIENEYAALPTQPSTAEISIEAWRIIVPAWRKNYKPLAAALRDKNRILSQRLRDLAANLIDPPRGRPKKTKSERLYTNLTARAAFDVPFVRNILRRRYPGLGERIYGPLAIRGASLLHDVTYKTLYNHVHRGSKS